MLRRIRIARAMRKTPGRANAWPFLLGRYPLAEWEKQLLLRELPSQR